MRQRVIIIWLPVLIFAFAATAQAQTFWVESQNTLRDSKVTPQANVYASGKIGEKFGLFTWSLLSEEWSEVIVGPTFSPNSSMEFAVGVGAETDKRPARVYVSSWFGGERGSLFLNWEDGGSGYYYLTEANLEVGKGFGVGVRGERFAGFGPRVEYKFDKFLIWVWPVAWDPEANGARSSSISLRFNIK